jgi:hypothetical protein
MKRPLEPRPTPAFVPSPKQYARMVFAVRLHTNREDVVKDFHANVRSKRPHLDDPYAELLLSDDEMRELWPYISECDAWLKRHGFDEPYSRSGRKPEFAWLPDTMDQYVTEGHETSRFLPVFGIAGMLAGRNDTNAWRAALPKDWRKALPFKFRLPAEEGWFPQGELREDAGCRIRELFERNLGDYLNRIERLAKEAGFQSPKRKYTRERTVELTHTRAEHVNGSWQNVTRTVTKPTGMILPETRHYDWVIRRTVKPRESAAEIARSCDEKRNTVVQACNRLLVFLAD